MTNGRSPTLVTLPPWRAAACPSGHSYSMAISIATSARSMTTFSRGLPGVTRSTEICAWVCSEESVRVSPVAGSVTCSRYSGEGIAPAQAFPAPVFIPVVASVPSSPSCKRRSICPLPIRYSVICPSPSVHGPETFSPWAGFPYPAPFARHGRNQSSGLLVLPFVFTVHSVDEDRSLFSLNFCQFLFLFHAPRTPAPLLQPNDPLGDESFDGLHWHPPLLHPIAQIVAIATRCGVARGDVHQC